MLAIVVAVVVSFIAGFLSGGLFFTRHEDRIKADVSKVSDVVQHVKDTTKSL